MDELVAGRAGLDVPQGRDWVSIVLPNVRELAGSLETGASLSEVALTSSCCDGVSRV